MEPTQAKSYLARARELAKFYARVGILDRAGADYDDFVSEMVLKGWLAWRYHGRTKGFGGRGERLYILRAMRNRAKDLIRGTPSEACESMGEEPLDGCCLHRQVEARLQLARLDRKLRGWQRELLVAVAMGESGAAYAASRGWHHSRLAKARKRAAKIIGAD